MSVASQGLEQFSILAQSQKRMDDESIDREERKREYNRLAQREFRRRRKEHLKSLEQAQKERTSEQSGEIERLRHQNAELRRENEALKAHLYGLTGSQHVPMTSAVPSSHLHQHQHSHSYPDSPSISSTIDSISGTGSPPPPLGQDMIPLSGLSLTSGAQHPSITSQYNDAMLLSYFPSQRYSMVTSSSVRHNARSSPESSDFGSPQPPPMGQPTSNVQYMNMPAQAPSSQPQANGNIRSNYRHLTSVERLTETSRYSAP